MAEISLFTADQAQALTGLSNRQLGYWDHTGFFSPEYIDEGKGPFRRLYSFRDIVGLRTIAILRKQHDVPLQELRRVGDRISKHHGPWASLTFWVGGKRVFFENPDTGTREGARPPGQTVLPIEMERIDRDVKRAVEKLRQRLDSEIGQVSRNRHIAQNLWTVAGTRIPTRAIWDFHAVGYDVDSILRQYPALTKKDVEEAIAWESQQQRAS